MMLLATTVDGSGVWNFEFGSLGFVWVLEFGACNFHNLIKQTTLLIPGHYRLKCHSPGKIQGYLFLNFIALNFI
jgi:hypothetical protein